MGMLCPNSYKNFKIVKLQNSAGQPSLRRELHAVRNAVLVMSVYSQYPSRSFRGVLAMWMQLHQNRFDRVLKRKFVPKKEEMTGGWRKLRNENLHDLCSEHNIVLKINPLNPELNPICYLLALLAHHFFRVSRIIVKSLTLRLLMSYIYIYIYIYIWSTYS